MQVFSTSSSSLLNLFQRKTLSTEPDHPAAVPTAVTPPPHAFPVLTSDALLKPRIAALNRIEELAGVPAQHFITYYLSPLRQYAAFVQQLPASEVHHHAAAGGLLDHTLDVITHALVQRQGYVLPPNTVVEALVHLKDVWTYAVFVAALCHDLAKPAVDQVVTPYDAQGKSLGRWDPWSGNLDSYDQVAFYSTEFVRNRSYRLHEKASLLLVHRILPANALAWLASDQQALAAVCACISGDSVGSEIIGEIIGLADRESVGRNLGAEPTAHAAKTSVVPLHEKLVLALRQLIEDKTLPLNRNGAAGWREGNKLWLVSKRVVDSMRIYLSQTGHTGIPTDNQRLFDILQEQQILEPNQDRAIWRMTVQGDTWRHDLSLICIPLSRLWSNPDAWPEIFPGSVSESRQDSQSIPTDSTPHEHPESFFPEQTSTAVHPPKARETHADNSTSVSKPDKEPKDDLGLHFLDWLVAGIQERTLDYNNSGARIHVVDEGVLLVSPGLFKDFAKQFPDHGTWETVQKKFLKLDLHERAAGGLNVHSYQISGANQSGKLNALLIKDTCVVFKGGKPSSNPHVTKNN